MEERLEPHAQFEVAQHAARLLRRPEVEARTGLSRSTLYEWMRRGEFPRPVKLGARAVGWPEGEIAAWLEARKAERDAA